MSRFHRVDDPDVMDSGRYLSFARLLPRYGGAVAGVGRREAVADPDPAPAAPGPGVRRVHIRDASLSDLIEITEV